MNKFKLTGEIDISANGRLIIITNNYNMIYIDEHGYFKNLYDFERLQKISPYKKPKNKFQLFFESSHNQIIMTNNYKVVQSPYKITHIRKIIP